MGSGGGTCRRGPDWLCTHPHCLLRPRASRLPAVSAPLPGGELSGPAPSAQDPGGCCLLPAAPSPSASRWPPRCLGQTRCAHAGWTRRRRGWTGLRARTRGSCPPGRWSLWRDCQGLDSTLPRHGYGYCSQGRTRLREEGKERAGRQTGGREKKDQVGKKQQVDGERQETETPSRCSLGPSANKHMQGCLPPPHEGTRPSQHPGSSRAPPRAPLYLPHPAWACGLLLSLHPLPGHPAASAPPPCLLAFAVTVLWPPCTQGPDTWPHPLCHG